jgi:hypothetical protein
MNYEVQYVADNLKRALVSTGLPRQIRNIKSFVKQFQATKTVLILDLIDRIDITGARWGLERAEAVLKLRSIKSAMISWTIGNSTKTNHTHAFTHRDTRNYHGRMLHDSVVVAKELHPNRKVNARSPISRDIMRQVRISLIAIAIASFFALVLSGGEAPAEQRVFAAGAKTGVYDSAYFKQWFDKFYRSLYYARSLKDIEPYYSLAFRARWDNLDDKQKEQELEHMKQYYVARPKITKLTFEGEDYPVTVEMGGTLLVERRRGYGTASYEMIKDHVCDDCIREASEKLSIHDMVAGKRKDTLSRALTQSRCARRTVHDKVWLLNRLGARIDPPRASPARGRPSRSLL